MKILVTGGTGFTGKALVKRLIDDGHEVVSLDYQEGLKTEEIRSWGAKVVIGSVTDREVVKECMQGVELVQHLAAAFRELDVANEYYDEVNIHGTEIVLEEAHKVGVKKFIYCSTCGVHGNVENPPGGEDSPIAPGDYYQRTKYEAEPKVLAYGDRMEVCIIRPAAIYGPGDPDRFRMIFRQVSNGTFYMFGSGKTFYHPLYIDNLVDAFVLAMEPGKGKDQAYLIADEEYIELNDLVARTGKALGVNVKIPHFPIAPLIVAGHICETICKPFKITPPIFPRRVDWFRQNRAFDISKAKRDLGYNPAIGLDEGLKRTGEWYRKEGYIS